MGPHFEYGFAPKRTSRAILEAFALTLAIQSETRGSVVADSADAQLARLIDLADQVGLECLRLCGGFVSWIRLHIHCHTWANSAMVAAAAILMLSAAKLSAQAAERCRAAQLRPYGPDELEWSRLLRRAEDTLSASVQEVLSLLDESNASP
jgi:hypothetical protein